MQLNFLGLNFHLYGFILGLSIVGAIWLFEWLVEQWRQQANLAEAALAKYWQKSAHYWQVLAGALVGGVIGARWWHVLTDLELYLGNLVVGLLPWQGGLSVLGAITGGLGGVWLVVAWQAQAGCLPSKLRKRVTLSWLDLAVLVVPLAQALGRLGNYVNQELYGPPSTFPWAIEIEVSQRLPEYASFASYHPLFLYEMIGLVVLAAWLWRQRWRFPEQVGSGSLLMSYLVGYGLLRFGLDFLRLDKGLFLETGLTLNQIIIGLIMIAILIIKLYPKQWRPVVIATLIGTGLSLFLSTNYQLRTRSLGLAPEQTISSSLAVVIDRSLVEVAINHHNLTVEVVNSPQSITRGLSGRTEIGSDGLLFILGQPQRTGFWMKEMNFDLDLVWLLEGEVVAITADVPAPARGVSMADLPIYDSPGPVDMVLELPAGQAQELAISPGDRLQINNN